MRRTGYLAIYQNLKNSCEFGINLLKNSYVRRSPEPPNNQNITANAGKIYSKCENAANIGTVRQIRRILSTNQRPTPETQFLEFVFIYSPKAKILIFGLDI